MKQPACIAGMLPRAARQCHAFASLPAWSPSSTLGCAEQELVDAAKGLLSANQKSLAALQERTGAEPPSEEDAAALTAFDQAMAEWAAQMTRSNGAQVPFSHVFSLKSVIMPACRCLLTSSSAYRMCLLPMNPSEPPSKTGTAARQEGPGAEFDHCALNMALARTVLE
jgi:hypothetical protein